MTTATSPTISSADVAAAATRLVERLATFPRLIVAFSGGVDSTVVAAAAQRAMGKRATAVTAVSPSVPQYQLQWARRLAEEIGITHQEIPTSEVELPEYQQNDMRRCYHCKRTLYGAIAAVVEMDTDAVIVSGTNLDDLGDYRPGIVAGDEAGVCAPLAELGINKDVIRQIARLWELSNWNLPAAPCLASRIAYGVEVTLERLARVEAAENWLRQRGMCDLRVRLHEGELARVEVPLDKLSEITSASVAAAMVNAFNELGFRFVTLDLAGLRTGSLNQLVQIDANTP